MLKSQRVARYASRVIRPSKILLATAAALILAVSFVRAPLPASLTEFHDANRDAVSLLSTQTALIMNGTYEPVITDAWIDQVMANFITPTLGPGYTGTATAAPEEFWPVTGLGSLTFNKSIKAGYELLDAQVHQSIQDGPRTPVAVFGYSQSAIIQAVQKRSLATEYTGATDVPQVSFVMIGNPYPPNGGFLARIPLLAAIMTPWTQMTTTPTDTAFATQDIARQYDLWADFPTYPLNLLADVNALFGGLNHWYLPESVTELLKPVIQTVSLNPLSPNYNPGTVVQQYQDTTYYLIPSEHLPLTYPLRWIGLGGLMDVVEPTLRVLVELGYDRTVPNGEVTRAKLFPNINWVTLRADLEDAVDQGGRAFGKLLGMDTDTGTSSSVEAQSYRVTGIPSASRARGTKVSPPSRPDSTRPHTAKSSKRIATAASGRVHTLTPRARPPA